MHETIDLNSKDFGGFSDIRYTYLKHLNTTLEQQNRIKASGNVSTHSFNRVDEIRYNPYDRSSRYHVGELFKSCYALRENLTHLHLRLLGTDLTAGNQTGTYMQFFLQFKYLKDFTIDNGNPKTMLVSQIYRLLIFLKLVQIWYTLTYQALPHYLNMKKAQQQD